MGHYSEGVCVALLYYEILPVSRRLVHAPHCGSVPRFEIRWYPRGTQRQMAVWERAMPRLTKRLIDSLKPKDRGYVVWDSDVKGFGGRVRPSGRITYILKYRVGGGRSGIARKPAIGARGSITTDQARAIARGWLAEVARGGDPGGQPREDKSMLTAPLIIKAVWDSEARV